MTTDHVGLALAGGFILLLVAIHLFERWRASRVDPRDAQGLAIERPRREIAKPEYRASFIAIFFIGAMLAVAFPVFYVWERLATDGSEHWLTATGRVDASNYSRRRSRSSASYVPRITYSYVVDGQRYSNDDVWLSVERSYNSPEEAIAFLADYPVGGPAQVHYAPGDPQRAALIMTKSEGLWPLWFGAAGLALAGLGWTFRYPAAYRRQRRAAAQSPDRPSGF